MLGDLPNGHEPSLCKRGAAASGSARSLISALAVNLDAPRHDADKKRTFSTDDKDTRRNKTRTEEYNNC